MRRFVGGWLMACLWLFGAAACPGQLTDSLGRLNVDLPKPPPSNVLDAAAEATAGLHPLAMDVADETSVVDGFATAVAALAARALAWPADIRPSRICS